MRFIGDRRVAGDVFEIGVVEKVTHHGAEVGGLRLEAAKPFELVRAAKCDGCLAGRDLVVREPRIPRCGDRVIGRERRCGGQ